MDKIGAKITYLNSLKNEGYGSLLQRELFAFFVALDLSIPFVRCGNQLFTGHDDKDISSAKINTDWGDLFSFMGGEESDLECVLVKSTHQIDPTKNVVFDVPFEVSYEYFCNLTDCKREMLIDKARALFWTNYKFKKDKNKNDYLIVLHLRNISKGDVVCGVESLPWQLFSFDYGLLNNNHDFYTNLYGALVLKLIKDNSIPQKNIYVKVCSTGDSFHFDRLIKMIKPFANVELLLNRYAYDDFMLLLEADALIMAHSSFSWLAAFFNENEKYIRRGFRHLLPYDVHEFNDVIAFKYSYLHATIVPIQKVYFKLKNKIKVLSGGNQC